MAQPYHRHAVSFLNRAYSLDPLERVENIGGLNSDHTRWTLTQAAAISAIEAGTDEFFVNADGGPVRLVVLTHRGEKYLKSEREKTHPDDLLSLVHG
ncbi:MAG: DUF3892 domain-containing protein [Opitutaceae bacterium]